MRIQQGLTASPGSDKAHASGLRVVAIGGGTGLSTLLKGLKRYARAAGTVISTEATEPVIDALSAVVTVSDDGGSSVRLGDGLNMPSHGDARYTIVVQL